MLQVTIPTLGEASAEALAPLLGGLPLELRPKMETFIQGVYAVSTSDMYPFYHEDVMKHTRPSMTTFLCIRVKNAPHDWTSKALHRLVPVSSHGQDRCSTAKCRCSGTWTSRCWR